MSEGKTPTIEQKSTFASKTKEGSDVEFEAIIKFYINPTGNVRLNAPGGSSVDNRPSSDGGTPSGSGGTSGPPPAHSTPKALKEEITETKETKPTVTKADDSSKQKDSKAREDKQQDSKFNSNKEIDKQIPRIQGDCAISQFVPDPCKAVDDLTKSIKGFFSSFSSGCPPCPEETSNFVPAPQPQQLVAGELEHGKNQAGNEVMEKEVKYEV